VFLRDGFKCQACGVFVTIRKGDAHCDHNLQTLCDGCHAAKTRRGE
jgi:5-methylcytosine-specific restriction endonuclease McrA